MSAEVYKIQKITDEFARKMFLSKMPEKPNKQELEKTVEAFEKIKDDRERVLSLHYLHTVISEKYQGKNQRGITGLKKELMMTCYRELKDVFYWHGLMERMAQDLEDLIKTLKNHPNTLLDMAKRVSQKQAPMSLKFYVYNAIEDKEQSASLREDIVKNLDEKFQYGSLLNLSEELKFAFVEGLAEQYREVKYRN